MTLSTTRHADWNPNQFSWPIDRSLATRFEDFFAHYLRCLFGEREGIRVRQTPRSGDRGRDIELDYSGATEIGGIALPPVEPGGRVFIECKTTFGEKLDDGFVSDASQHLEERFDAYLLVTNAVITPYTHYRAAQMWKRIGARFLLLDRARLYRAWDEANLIQQARDLHLAPLAPPPAPSGFNGICVATQSELAQPSATTASGDAIVETYMTVRNHSRQSQKVAISLATDIDWSADSDGPLQVILAPGEDQVHRLKSKRERYDPTSPLRFTLTGEARAHNITVVGKRPQLVLEPPFVGAGHRELLASLRRTVEQGSGLRLVSIHGEAGVGKSRTIEEAASVWRGSRYVFRMACDPRSGRFDVAELGDRVAQALHLPASDTDRPATLSEVPAFLARMSVGVVLLLEDLHHAAAEDIDALKQLVVVPPSAEAPLTLIITGRDDYTFPNVDYFALLDLLQTEERPHVSMLALGKLTDEDAETLIRVVATNLPEVAVAHVHRLGQCNPFILIEMLQYFLDTGLARLLSRRTIGVIDPERFIGLEGLPTKVEELYVQRLAALRSAYKGAAAEELLFALSCLAPDSGHDLIEAWTTRDGDAVVDLLVERRFLLYDSFACRVGLAHENLYHFLRREMRATGRSEAIASALLEVPELMRLTDDLSRAELLSLADRHGEAFALFAPAWSAVQAMSNFSSEEIDRDFYSFFPTLFSSARAVGEAPGDLAKVAAALAYMGVHNFPLVRGERACAHAEQMIEQIYPFGAQGNLYLTAISQLRSHALQNLGRTGLAFRRMMELEARFKESGEASPQIAFDLYDRLQEHHRKANHAELMEHYGRLAERAVAEAEDDKLQAAHLITMSLMSIYRPGNRASDAAAKALDASERAGILRFAVFNKLTGLVGQAVAARDDAAQLKDISDRARELLRHAASNTYSDSIIRLQLLLATLAPHIADSPERGRRRAQEYISAGQESSVRFGIGLYDWAFDNLAGALDFSDPNATDEDARRRFDTCLARLRRRGLTFVGACSGTYPNTLALANIVRFYANFQESAGAAVIEREVTAYETNITMEETSVRRLLSTAIAGGAIFWPKENRPMLRLPGKLGYFTPIV